MKIFLMKFKTSRLLFAAMICVTFIGTTTAAHSAEKIAWKFKAKQTFHYAQEITTKKKVDMPGAPAAIPLITNIIKRDFIWTVDKVNKDGSCQMSQIIKRVTVEQKLGARQRFKYDSDVDTRANRLPVVAMFAIAHEPYVGEKVAFTMAENGTITNIQPTKECLKAIKNLAGNATKATDFFKEIIHKSIVPLPTKAVAVNSTWKNQRTETHNYMGATVQYRYKYSGAHQQGKIRYANIEMTPKMVLVQHPGMLVQPVLKKQGGTGSTVFDLTNGRLKNNYSDQTMTITTKQGNKTMTLETETIIKTDLVSAKSKPPENKQPKN